MSCKERQKVDERCTKASLSIVDILFMDGVRNSNDESRKDPYAKNDWNGNMLGRVPAEYQDKECVDCDGLASSKYLRIEEQSSYLQRI